MSKSQIPKPPTHLRLATRKWWQRVVTQWVLDEHHTRLLTLAAQAWDSGQEAREALRQHGLTYKTRFGEPKARPEVKIEGDCRIQFARLIRELNLDVPPPEEDNRPPRVR